MRTHWIWLVVILLGACSERPRDLRIDPDAGPPTAREVVYTVREGETWQDVAENFFGDARNAARIAEDNGSSLQLPPLEGSEVRVRILADEVDAVRAVAEARGAYNAGVEAMQTAGGDEEAREAFETALRKAPHLVDARYNLGLVLLRLERPRDARDHLAKVVAQRPNDPDALYALAAAHFHLADYAAAVELLDRCLAIDPTLLRARFTHALALQRLGRTREAIASWQAYLERDATSAWAEQARDNLRQLGS